MDELLHHCLRELSFDGDLGCNVSRLGDFINDFYNHSFTARGQKVDDAFCAFVWSLVVQQPTVRVGTIPDGITSEVWIAPQTSAKRKANAKGEEHVEVQPAELILVPDAKSTPLAELQEEYGDKLRIASNPDAIYASITGSHIRFPKMSPMVYSALQIITRGRDDGVTVVQLGQQSNVKVRRGGVGTHFVIHRYFFERSPSWKAIREEEISAELTRKGAEQPKPDVPDEEEKDKETADSLNFTPIDARHLSSLPLVRARVVKLLKASRNHMHVSSNMLLTIGFSNPTKTDRRFFQSRIRELVQQGILEKVIVPNSRKKSSSVLCLRLVDEKGSSEGKDDDDDDVVVLRPQDDKDEEDFSQDGVKMNMTIHKQIIDLLEQSGTTGMTLNELSSALCNFDKRTIELLLTRAEKFPPPTHLSDLGIAGLMETSGRERRHRYFTVSAYRTLVAREGLDQSTAGYGDVDLSQAEQFMSVEADAFYDNEASLEAYQDAFKEEISGKGGKGKKSASTASASAVKRTKSKKRAREEDGEPSASTRKGKKRKVAADDGEGAEGSISVGPVGMNNEAASKTPSVPKKRGRVAKDTAASEGAEGSISSAPKRRGRPPKDPAGASATPKKRGRPRKNPVVSTPAEPSGESADTPVATSSVAITQDVSGITPENGDQDRERLPPSPARNSRVQSEMPDGEDPAPLPESTLPDGQVAGVQPMQEERDGTEQRDLTTLPVDASATEGPDSGHVQTMDVDTVAEYDPSYESMHISADEPAQVNRQPDTDVQMASDEAALSGISPDRPAGVSTQQPTRAASLAPVVLAQSQSMTPRLSQAAHDVPQSGPSRLMPGTQPAQSRGRVNVSNLRRENELLRVVEIMGGIVNIQTKEIYDTHMTLLETLAKEGEPTSSPVGIRTDKRTVASTFSSLKSRGKIKQVTTSIPSHLGMTRPTVVVYLPTVDQEKVNSFLAELSRSAPPPVPSPYGRKISEPLDYGADATRLTKNALPLQLLQLEKPGTDNNERWIKNAARADQLFALDEATIREVLLTERTTIGQYHGTIVAKMLRARELHLSLLKAFETGASSAQIVSHGQRIIKIDYLCQELPLDCIVN
ncbi:hypothetical protein D9758_018452 [Tetrapyrgos nigripes]|uniref:B-block binding subunit of TFIIIC domain-containing protein n=1 Tax=Tetrapyrgos nigripes TaxID=182062 RepID=A0A8H5BAT3_9AGAR|nr:hypothetical protein D9758_018452 [Tetrapyrgos nigripes]